MNHPRNGPATDPTPPTVLHEAYGRQLAELVERMRTGRMFSDPATTERLTVVERHSV